MKTKYCPRCNDHRPIDEFGKNSAKKDGFGSFCRKHQKEYSRNHYTNNKKYYVDKASRHKDEIKELVCKHKSVPCTDCKTSYPYWIMQFDHLYDKKFSIANWRNRGYTIDKILNEIKKCEVVCANCHADRTHRRRNISP